MYFLALLVTSIGALFSGSVYACPVCGFGQDGSSSAFLGATALLTLAPLIMFGVIGFFLYRLAKKHRAL
jgi:hypothetical protein